MGHPSHKKSIHLEIGLVCSFLSVPKLNDFKTQRYRNFPKYWGKLSSKLVNSHTLLRERADIEMK